MKRLPSLLFALIASLATPATANPGTTSGSPAVADAPTSAPVSTARIVSLGAAVTETLYELGAAGQVVAVDASVSYPEETARLPKLNYYRQLSAEGVLSLRPTMVIGTTDVGPAEALTQLRGAGVQVVLIPFKPSPDSTRLLIRELGRALNREARAGEIVARMDASLAETQQRIAARKAGARPRVLFIYARSGAGLNVGGRGTAGDSLIRLAGGENALGGPDGIDGFRPLTAEAVATANPDVVFVLDGGYATLGGVDGVLKQPGISLTPAGKNRRVVHLDDTLALGFGPRLGEGVAALAAALYPGLAANPEGTGANPDADNGAAKK